MVIAATLAPAAAQAARAPDRGGFVPVVYRAADAEGELPPDAVLAVATAAIEEGIRQMALTAIPPEETSVRLARVAYSPDAAELRAAARKRLDAAYESYFNLDLDAAALDLEEAANALARTAQTPDDLALLSDLKLLSGMISLASKPEDAVRDFDTVVRLTPGRQLDALRFPPHAIAALEEAERRFRMTPVTQVNIETTPADVRVAIDGIVQGRTPLSLDRIATGEHYYRLEKAGFAPQFGRIVLAGGTLETVRVHLEVATAETLGQPIGALAEAAPADARAGLVKLFAADKVVVAEVARSGPRHFRVTLWWLDEKGASGLALAAELPAEPALFTQALVEKTREALALGAGEAPGVSVAFPALARDVGLLAAGRAKGRLDPPPPPWYRRWQLYAGAAGAVVLGGLAFIARENAKPGTVDYHVTEE